MNDIQVKYNQENISPSCLQEILDTLILTSDEQQEILEILNDNDVQYYED